MTLGEFRKLTAGLPDSIRFINYNDIADLKSEGHPSLMMWITDETPFTDTIEDLISLCRDFDIDMTEEEIKKEKEQVILI